MYKIHNEVASRYIVKSQKHESYDTVLLYGKGMIS